MTSKQNAGREMTGYAEPTEKPARGMVDAELKGNTLRVYVSARKKKKVGVREVQRALLMSIPSLAQYHLNKLRDLGLVSEESGDYEIRSEVKVDVMRDFLRVGTLIVPRLIFYAVLFSALACYTISVAYPYYGVVPAMEWLSFLMTTAAVAFWYEAIRAWRSAPVA